MLQDLWKENVFIYIMLGLCGLGILMKLITFSVYHRMQKASGEISSTKHKWMEMMKVKFETCHQLHMNVHNVDSFVDKYVYKYKFCGLHLYTWENISGQFFAVCFLVGLLSTGFGVLYECGQTEILWNLLMGIITGGLLIIIDNFMNLHTKKQILKVNIKDYFENILEVRLNAQEAQPELVKQYKKEVHAMEKQVELKKQKKRKFFHKKKSEKKEQLEKLKLELVEELKKDRLLEEEKRISKQDQREYTNISASAAGIDRVKAMEKKQIEEGLEELVQSFGLFEAEEEMAAAKPEEKTKIKHAVAKKKTTERTVADKTGQEQAESAIEPLNKDQERAVEDILKEYLA